MKLLRFAGLLLLPLVTAAKNTDADSGLYFNDSKYALAAPTNTTVYHGVRTALLVDPDDHRDIGHWSNSNMARVALHVVTPEGGANSYQVPLLHEQVFIILEGVVEFIVDGQKLTAHKHDVIFVPAGSTCGFTATGQATARIIQANWQGTTGRGRKATGPLIISSGSRPLIAGTGEGYITVVPSPRQQGVALSITGYGGHVKLSNAPLLYPADLDGPPRFAANTLLARVGLSHYAPGGGTTAHTHPEREQAFVVLSGRSLWEIGPNTLEVKADDIIFAPRQVFHGHKVAGDQPFVILELEWSQDPSH